MGDLGFAVALGGGFEFAKLASDVVGFEVDARDAVIGTATLDDGPFGDVISNCAQEVAHVGLLEELLVTGASPAIGEELLGGNPLGGKPGSAMVMLNKEQVQKLAPEDPLALGHFEATCLIFGG